MGERRGEKGRDSAGEYRVALLAVLEHMSGGGGREVLEGSRRKVPRGRKVGGGGGVGKR
jgi:hypothetical protein